ncbi:MAG: bifunctional phosphopantothenoylcysteine decarboxylase/phosphopantothenate--cysteine ligase CoaBC [Anaerolineae bacterium]|nr:bifunctional phosphopantothenoylcysteine decarboxylase/phosphopantothenate--cysteine ligase CoaBC [Anaerolineae bacterium]
MSNPIEGKRIVLGITGSIAAYKAADLASKLTQAGALVDCILTEAAVKFMQPITFQSVTGRKAYVDADLWGSDGHVVHIALGRAAELLLIAPATASTMAKLAHGIGDNLLAVTALAADCPLMLAPAMDAGMFSHPATAENVRILQERGAIFIGPEPGRLASGLVGKGRFTEPVDILAQVRWHFSRGGVLAGKKVLITAGPTREAIDPVRYLSNASSGKQGYAIAQALQDAGAEVTLVSGPTALTAPVGAYEIPVVSAAEMKTAVMTALPGMDAFISVAAVADFTPAELHPEKWKKTGESAMLALNPTEDILQAVSDWRTIHQPSMKVVGFAAETQDLLENAANKLAQKRLDLVVANDVSGVEKIVFGAAENRVAFLDRDGSVQQFDWMDKYQVGEEIVRYLVQPD